MKYRTTQFRRSVAVLLTLALLLSSLGAVGCSKRTLEKSLFEIALGLDSATNLTLGLHRAGEIDRQQRDGVLRVLRQSVIAAQSFGEFLDTHPTIQPTDKTQLLKLVDDIAAQLGQANTQAALGIRSEASRKKFLAYVATVQAALGTVRIIILAIKAPTPTPELMRLKAMNETARRVDYALAN